MNINKKGEFVRKDSVFRNFVTADGSSGFKAEEDRYHLYVSLACPWAHRVLIVRALKGLEHVLPYTVVDWYLDFSTGWKFNEKVRGCSADTVNNATYLRELYEKSTKDFGGKVTVPVLWDKKTSQIVNNESSEIIRMLNTEFNQFCKTEAHRKLNLYPEHLHQEIDSLNEWIYPQINNGVYRSGFATTQEAYEAAVHEVFDGLDKVENILSKKHYLTGSNITEADIRLFTTLVRFDAVYVGHFKCNLRRIIDYPNIWGYLRELYQIPEIKPTVDMEHIKKHYYMSHTSINPCQVVPIGPAINFEEPHEREGISI